MEKSENKMRKKIIKNVVSQSGKIFQKLGENVENVRKIR